jgi:hypothetical protein
MSGTAYNWGRWLGHPLPFYDDPAHAVPWGLAPDQANAAGARSAQVGGIAPTMQDTGGNWIGRVNPGRSSVDYTPESLPGGTFGGQWSEPSTQVPYAAPSTIGGAGGGATSWNLPEWAYGGNQKGGGTYNQQTGQWDNGAPLAAGADVFGAKLPVGYNSAQDRGGLEYNGKNVETFWSRMLRFAKDSGLPPDQAMRAALDRIRRDNGGTLAGTGFQEGGGATGAPAATTTGGGNTGGKTVDPSNGTGLPIPGGTPSPIPTPGVPGAAGPLNSIGGQKLANSPELAWRYLVQQMGGDADYEGPFSNYMQSNFAPALAAMINARMTGAGRAPGAQGLAGMDQVGNYIGEFQKMLGGNDLFTKLGAIGSQGLAAGGGLLNQASSQDAGNFVRQMLALTGMGNAPLAQSAQQYLTNKMMNDYTMSSISSPTGESPLGKFGTYLQHSNFMDRLKQLGLLR